MKIKLLLIPFFSFFGIISCNSDNTPPKTYILQETFTLQPPEIIRSKNQEVLTWDQFSKPKAPYSLEDVLIFHNHDMAEIKVESSCTQDEIQHNSEYPLVVKNKYFLREFLPLEIVKAFKNSLITCHFNFQVQNANKSRHDFEINSILIDPRGWTPVVSLEVPRSPYANRFQDFVKLPYLTLEQIQNSNLDFSKTEMSNHLDLDCKNLKSIQLFHPYLELNKLDWTALRSEWQKAKNPALYYTCHFLISHKIGNSLRPLGWTQEFRLLSPLPNIHLKKSHLEFKNNHLVLEIPKLTNQDLYIRVLKSELYRALEIKDGFHLFKSNLIDSFKYIQPRRALSSDFNTPQEPFSFHSSPAFWVYTTQLHKPRIRSISKNIKLMRETAEEWIFKSVGPQKMAFIIDFVRPKGCQNVFVEFSKLNFVSEFPMTFHVDSTHQGLSVPIDKILLHKKIHFIQPQGLTKNKTIDSRFLANYPELKIGVHKKTRDQNQAFMLKNEFKPSPCLNQYKAL